MFRELTINRTGKVSASLSFTVAGKSNTDQDSKKISLLEYYIATEQNN
jgi:hypothetical protein